MKFESCAFLTQTLQIIASLIFLYLRSDKEKIVANLFASSATSSTEVGGVSGKKKILIEEVGGDGNISAELESEQQSTKAARAHVPVPVPVPVSVTDEGPSLLEQMMAAQSQAKSQDDAAKARRQKKEEQKGLGGGFKKGIGCTHTHSLTHPLTHSLTHPLTHSLTHSLTSNAQ
jgi:hypothetical protein